MSYYYFVVYNLFHFFKNLLLAWGIFYVSVSDATYRSQVVGYNFVRTDIAVQ